MREEELIRSILGNFRRSPMQENAPFAADAEIINIAEQLWAVTVDEFSPEEDGFTSISPERLGHNMVTAVVSDLFAVGATPSFFLHSIVFPEGDNRWDKQYTDNLTRSIGTTLEKVGACCIGGDIGCGENWRYTGVALGQIETSKAITRLLPREEQEIWVTGWLGDANLAMLQGREAPVYELRAVEARVLALTANSCIDTSGGLVEALWALAALNPEMEFEIDAGAVPFDDAVMAFAREKKISPMAFLFGEAGEYELLFTLAEGLKPGFDATRIGSARIGDNPGLAFQFGGQSRNILEPPPSARQYASREEYIQAILNQVDYVLS